MNILALGINHLNAPLDVRAALYFDANALGRFLRRLVDGGVCQGAVGLSTCNRLEFYLSSPHPREAERQLFGELLTERPQAQAMEQDRYARVNEDAARHLFRVASGIDSQVVGEDQIFAQVKQAYQLSLDAGASSSPLNFLFQHAFHVAKRTRTETRIGEGNVSVASVGVSFLKRMFSDLRRRKALLIGAGATGELVATTLAAEGVGGMSIANRTREKAEALAQRIGARVIAFEDATEGLIEVDIVICATEAPKPILTAALLRSAMARRGNRLLAALDISVPRNIEPEADGIPQLFVYDLESLQEVCEENRRARQQEIQRVEAIVAEETERFLSRAAALHSDAIIRALRRRMDNIRAGEIQRYGSGFAEKDRARLERFSESLLNKALHDLTGSLKGLARDPGGALAELDALCRALRLDPEAEAAPDRESDAMDTE